MSTPSLRLPSDTVLRRRPPARVATAVVGRNDCARRYVLDAVWRNVDCACAKRKRGGWSVMAYQCRTTDVSRVQIVEVCPKGRRGMPQARLCAARAAAGVGGKGARVSQGQQKGAQSAGQKKRMRIIMMIIDVWPEYCSCDQAPPGGAPGGAGLPSAA